MPKSPGHEHPAQKGDYYVLCSDGLTDMVEDEDIHLTISTFNANLDVVGQQLIQLSNDHGGKDNVSVILAQVTSGYCQAGGSRSTMPLSISGNESPCCSTIEEMA